tara:strand:- start:259 stop:720 length:462 start_codon:yes stop_codon:yes gene_type:complete
LKLIRLYLESKRAKKALTTRPGEEGFSLVELVVVIAVLAILSAVAIPAFQGVQARAKTSALKNGLTNGIKECIVSDGLDEGTTFDKSRAFAGNYTGYTVSKRNGSVDSCYKVQAASTDTNLPWFVLEYDPLTGVSTKTCDGSKPIGCKSNGSW